MNGSSVDLVPIDEQVLGQLLAVAVADASPDEVMAPIAGEPGWTAARRDAFVAYHRSRRHHADLPLAEVTFAVTRERTVVGAARLCPEESADTFEVGLWLARSVRGLGLGAAVLPIAALRARDLGARCLVARTTAANQPAVRALAAHGFDISRSAAGQVEGRLSMT